MLECRLRFVFLYSGKIGILLEAQTMVSRIPFSPRHGGNLHNAYSPQGRFGRGPTVSARKGQEQMSQSAPAEETPSTGALNNQDEGIIQDEP